MYVITGVTGRVGSRVAADLIAQGAKVRAIVRDGKRAAEWSGRGADTAIASLEDRMSLRRALDGAEGFFTMLPENVDPEDFHGARRRMADAAADAVRHAGVPHVVLLSAIAAVLPDGNGPAKDLHYCENALRASGTTLTAVRACYFQDNVASVIPAAVHAGIFPSLMPPDAAFPMIATKDVGRFAATLLTERPPAHEIVDLFGPAYSMRQVAAALGASLGKPLQVVAVPPERHVAALMESGVPRQPAEAIAEMLAAFAGGAIVPKGNRSLAGSTPLEDVIRESLARQAG